MRSLLASFFFLATATAAMAGGEIKPTYQATLDFVSAKSGCKRTDYPDFISFNCIQGGNPAVWYFTKPGSTAHPGVLRRYISNNANGSYFDTDAHSYGPDDAQPAFQAWMGEIARSISKH